MNTHKTKVKEVELKQIVSVEENPTANSYNVTMANGDVYVDVVSSQTVLRGDYLNVTDKSDIYHMSKRIVEGDNAKYEKL